MKEANYGPFYAAGLYPAISEIARKHGYACAVHGSVANDFDLVMIPWIEEAGDPQDIINALHERFAFDEDFKDDWGDKPHGRRAYKLHLSFGNCALDISFTPKVNK